MMQVLLDSNIVIYSLQSYQENLRKWLENHIAIVSAITQLEVLGYYNITLKEIDFATRYLSFCEIVPIDERIILKSIELRQNKKMSIGDAIIAGTALIHKLPLATANTKDFKHLENLELINPLEV